MHQTLRKIGWNTSTPVDFYNQIHELTLQNYIHTKVSHT